MVIKSNEMIKHALNVFPMIMSDMFHTPYIFNIIKSFFFDY